MNEQQDYDSTNGWRRMLIASRKNDEVKPRSVLVDLVRRLRVDTRDVTGAYEQFEAFERFLQAFGVDDPGAVICDVWREWYPLAPEGFPLIGRGGVR